MIWMLLIINIGTAGGTTQLQMNDRQSCERAAVEISNLINVANWQRKYICVGRTTGESFEVKP